jgi:serine/threonine protein kinase
VYEYLHGVNLREYVSQRNTWSGPRLNALTVLRTLVGVLRELHHPQTGGATPVLHMDIKPSNLMVLQASGEVRLIDFTGARYWRESEITQVAYTPESGGPEAFGGARAVGPAYDVHGFGAVAYYLVTGAYPRVDTSGVPHGEVAAPAWSTLRRHPMLEKTPRLRDHLHAPVADRPGERPQTAQLAGWVERLAELVRAYGVPDTGVDWHEPGETRTAPRVGGSTALWPQTAQTRMESPVSGPPISGPPVSGPPVSGPPVSGPPVSGQPGSGPPLAPAASAAATGRPDGRTPGSADGTAPIRGRASVPPPRPPRADTGVVIDPVSVEPDRPWRPPTGDDLRTLKLGWEYSGVGAAAAFVCWGIWAASNRGDLTSPLVTFVLVLVVAAGVFALSRLLGRLILEQRLGRPRRTARAAHAVVGVFLGIAGLGFLRQTPWVVDVLTWIQGLF